MTASRSIPEVRSCPSGDIAIVGVACTYPSARRAADFWTNIVNRVNAITDVSPGRWDPEVFYDPDPDKPDRLYCRQGGWIPDTYAFNPAKFGIPPASLDGGEPDHCLLLRCVYEAMDDAGYLQREFDRERVSVIIGKGNYVGPALLRATLRTGIAEQIMQIVRALRPDLGGEDLERLTRFMRSKMPYISPDSAPGMVPNIATGRVANRLNFMGQNLTVDAACASSLVATEIAIRNLLTGMDDMSIVGGIHIYNGLPFLTVFKVMRAVSLHSQIRPFDAKADGTMCGEGVGVLVLKRLADAERDSDRIYAVIKGVGSASDGRAKAVMVPRIEGEALAMKRAYDMAKLSPETVELVECHGTATVVGDATEIEALRSTFGPSPKSWRSCAIGSVKSMIGHAMPAAGAAAMIKTALALHHRILPPTLNVSEPHPLLREPDCQFYVNTETRPWIRAAGGHPRRAGVSAFGFGGINAHVVMEEYTKASESGQPTMLTDWECEAVVVEANSREELVAALGRLRSYVLEVQGVSLRDVAYTLNRSLRGLEFRVAIVAANLTDLAGKIEQMQSRLSNPDCTTVRERSGLYFFHQAELRNGKIAIMFPGEGSQYVNMLKDLCIHFPEVRECFDRADVTGVNTSRAPLSTVIYPAAAFSTEEEAKAESELWSIERATEAVLTADGAIFTLLEKLGVKPDMMTGHSAGEWVALATSGMVPLAEFLASIDELTAMYRGLVERTEVPHMAMLAVSAGRERINELAAQIGCEIHIANDNCPHQVVVVTGLENRDRLSDHLLRSGIFVEKLPYDRGYHTPAFTYICDPLRKFFEHLSLRAPRFPVYSCTTTDPYTSDPSEILDTAANTFARPLLFCQTIEKMFDAGARIFIEAGPRGNLTAFVDDVLRGKAHLSIPLDLFHRPGLLSLNHAIAMLAASHVELDFEPLYARRSARILSWDSKADTLIAEDKQPGTMQISICYPEFPTPAREEFPMPAVVQNFEIPAAAASVAHANGTASSIGHAHHHPEPAPFVAPTLNGGSDVAKLGMQLAATPAAVSPYPVPPSAAASCLADHFAVMDQFLLTQQDIMTAALRALGRFGSADLHNGATRAIASESILASVPVMETPVLPANGHITTEPATLRVDANKPVALVSALIVQPSSGIDLQGTLIQIVSERTGYPKEMLELDQDMEADLGIDSIKRIEIFSALRELSGDSALSGDGDMEAISKLKTLRQAVLFLQKQRAAEDSAGQRSNGLAGSSVQQANYENGAGTASGVENASGTNGAVATPQSTGAPARTGCFIESLTYGAEVMDRTSDSVRLRLALDLREHSYLRDHCLYFPSSEYGNEGDRVFIMPVTGSIELMCECAARLVSDLKPVGLRGVRVHRPLKVVENHPPTSIQLVARAGARGEVHVEIREDKPTASNLFSESTVVMSAAYPTSPAPMPLDFVGARQPSKCTGKDIYSTHRMFHGPSFQGIFALDQVAENGLVGRLEILPTDGVLASNKAPEFYIDPFLLDAAGQFVGYWPVEYKTSGYILLPIQIREITKYCDNPPPGSVVQCRLKVRDVQQRTLTAEYDILAPDGRLWLRVIGWEDWRFYWPDRHINMWRFAKTEQLGDPVSSPALESAGYCCCAASGDTEKDGISAITWSHIFLNRRELAEWEQLSSDVRGNWLHWRSMAKDAARMWLARHRDRHFYPADVELEALGEGIYETRVAGTPGPIVSCCNCRELVIAAAGPDRCAIVALDATPRSYSEVLSCEELDRIARIPDSADWKLRAVAAKQAAARYLRGDLSGDFWASLFIKNIDVSRGLLELVDPDSAVNAEDSVSVATTPLEDLTVAVAFK